MSDNPLVTSSEIYFSSVLPIDYTKTAFEAVTGWKRVPNVASFPADMLTRNNVEKETVADGTISKAGTLKAPEISFEFVSQISPVPDTVTLLKSAIDANTALSYKLELSDGSISYGVCNVTEYGDKGGAPNELNMKSVKFTRSTKTVVQVPAT